MAGNPALDVVVGRVDNLSVSFMSGGGVKLPSPDGWSIYIHREKVELVTACRDDPAEITLTSLRGYFPRSDYRLNVGDKIDVFGLHQKTIVLFFQARITDGDGGLNNWFISEGVPEVVK